MRERKEKVLATHHTRFWDGCLANETHSVTSGRIFSGMASIVMPVMRRRDMFALSWFVLTSWVVETHENGRCRFLACGSVQLSQQRSQTSTSPSTTLISNIMLAAFVIGINPGYIVLLSTLEKEI